MLVDIISIYCEFKLFGDQLIDCVFVYFNIRIIREMCRELSIGYWGE